MENRIEKMTLKSIRVNAKLSQEEAAKKLGVSQKTLSNWETGKTYPDQPQIENICRVYGVSYDFINFLA